MPLPFRRCSEVLSVQPRARARCVASLIGAFAISQTGCEWVMGGIPNQPRADQDGGRDAGEQELDGSEEGHDGSVVGRDSEITDDADIAPDDGGATDAAVPSGDGEGPDAELDAASGPDADVDAAPETCTSGTTWYRDEDGDGFGLTQDARTECPKPQGSWSTRGGDCQDQEAMVNPAQVHYFDAPYTGVDGSDSYDYDCKNGEQGSGNQLAGSASGCGLLSLLACSSGTGYLKTARVGDSGNPYCGSHSYQTCSGDLGCSGTSQVRQAGYVCR